ncbi:EboA domain-containing protein [Goodfellowiella coeruleoviolacea]|uniref:Sugar phosphate isomerase/epimerase n=1 Tax=Goodfellowiella coeruleoviolacea TaxID=334858 RepID=A0AAE3GHC8_9PSEU|nr:EboA domain-containing protein [Goodfellowiella coeruleoviolacea]MCP2168271.1 Sugar phosphate isomerase/epimerase [Goodfellowiella coeruleoviolacea]
MSAIALGYGTNGFANHRLADAVAVLADLGYDGVALTLDHAHLDPFAADLTSQVNRVSRLLSRAGLRVVVETGARYLLDARHKHQPTLLSDDPTARVDLLRRALRIAHDLGAECVSFWSGSTPSTVDDATAWRRLRDGVAGLLDEAGRWDVPLALEPEPGMLVQHLAQALRLRDELGAPDLLGITLDVGHCVAVEPVDAAECVRLAGAVLRNVQLDDMRPGVHEHLEFGQGQLDLPATLAALAEVGYTGLAAVELPRHSHAAPVVAERAIHALRHAMPAAPAAAENPVRPTNNPAPATATAPPDRDAGPRPVRPPSPDEVDHPWLVAAEQRVRAEPEAIRVLFPAVGREVGRAALRPDSDPHGLVHGTVDDLARVRLLTVLATALPDDAAATEVTELYRYGDDAERRGVLRGLSALPERPALVEAGLTLVLDALRSNDIRLVAAAMGEFCAGHLDQHSWRHGVLKCLFVGVPLAAVARLDRRGDAELRRMVDDYAAERRAAGRDVPADALRLLGST